MRTCKTCGNPEFPHNFRHPFIPIEEGIEEKISVKIKSKILLDIKILKAQSECQHIWDHYSFGFICSECGFYTGKNLELNKLITEVLSS